MQKHLITLLVMIHCFSTQDCLAVNEYPKLSHTVFIDSLRSGNHDAGGVDHYYFTVQLVALGNTKDDLLKKVEERRKIERGAETMGEIEINVLSDWQGSIEDVSYKFEGDALRQIVAQAMREFKVTESEVAVMVRLKIFEQEKKYIFFGEDQFIGEKIYYPIPPSKYLAPARTNLKLNFNDDKGLSVVFKVKYDDPISLKEPTEEVKDVPVPSASLAPVASPAPSPLK